MDSSRRGVNRDLRRQTSSFAGRHKITANQEDPHRGTRKVDAATDVQPRP